MITRLRAGGVVKVVKGMGRNRVLPRVTVVEEKLPDLVEAESKC